MSLADLAFGYGATKEIVHGYCSLYEPHFEPFKDTKGKILEIGVETGASLRTWRHYFWQAEIHGLDINPSCVPQGCIVARGDQANRLDLEGLYGDFKFAIIIDDGGHTMEQQQTSLDVLLPKVIPGGLYVIEDLQTSFRKAWGGGGADSTLAMLLTEKIPSVKHLYWIEAEHHGLAAVLETWRETDDSTGTE